jgi:hypothetical protein
MTDVEIMKTSERRFQWLGPILAVLVVSILGIFGYWLVDRDPPLDAVSGEFAWWEKDTPRRGHVIWRGIPTRSDCEGTIYRYIVDGEIVTLPPRKWEYRGPLENPNNDPITWDAPFDVPNHIDHDASYRNRIEFVCNPLHKLWPIPVAPPDVPFFLREQDKTFNYPRPQIAPDTGAARN